MNDRVLGKGLDLLSAKGGKFEINQLLFADDTALVAVVDEYRMAGKVLMAEVSRGRVRGRPRLGWRDCVKVTLGNRGMMVGGGCTTICER